MSASRPMTPQAAACAAAVSSRPRRPGRWFASSGWGSSSATPDALALVEERGAIRPLQHTAGRVICELDCHAAGSPGAGGAP